MKTVLAVTWLGAMAVVALGVISSLPRHTTCFEAQLQGQQRLFFGDPGAASATTIPCSYQFETSSAGEFVHFWSGGQSILERFSPALDGSLDVTGIPIPVQGGRQVPCHSFGGSPGLGGGMTCAYAFLQLSPAYKGVALQLQSAGATTTYLLVAAREVKGARILAW
jgi:hypothetical protein